MQSILMQQYRPIEVVILDAGSTDDSAAVIERTSTLLRNDGITVQIHKCQLMGVAASRNLAAGLATGDLLFFLDNDAALTSADDIGITIRIFLANPRRCLVTFRVLNGDTEQIDPSTWVYRRPAAWASRSFRTFTFVGGAFCVRATAFRRHGGFWDILTYSREEEDMAFALINDGCEILYSAKVTVRHYSDQRARTVSKRRKRLEMLNGLLVLWRRIPLVLAVPVCCLRIGTMSCVELAHDAGGISEVLGAVPEAARLWKDKRLVRTPITLVSVWRYIALHFTAANVVVTLTDQHATGHLPPVLRTYKNNTE